MDKNQLISLIKVPFGYGAGRPGSELGPERLLRFGLLEQWKELGYVLDEPSRIVLKEQWTHNGKNFSMKNAAKVLSICTELAQEVKLKREEGHFPFVLGGDHSISIGSLAGLTADGGSPGLIWIDAHSDLNTEETTPSRNMHGIPLAFGLGRAALKLADIYSGAADIDPNKTVLVAARELDPGEKGLIKELGIHCYTMHEIDKMGIQKVIDEAVDITGSGTDGVHLSFDIDSIDPMEAPGTGTPVQGGLSFREAHFAMELLYEAGVITSCDFVEVNPRLDRMNRTSKLAVDLIGSLFGKRIL
ncbi:arginase [Neobacillus mesonae]|nr:arginase [Neobacillus mesonae]